MTNQSMRQALGESLLELGQKNPRLLVLTADLGPSLRLTEFAQAFPERYFNVGVAEANLVGVAAGLALEGFLPFAGSFAAFLPGRCFDQIRVAVCQNQANVKLIGSHYGLTNPGDGASAQSIEDIALMRVLPGMTVLCPADARQTKQAVIAAANCQGPVYLRISRSKTPVFTQGGLEIGRAQVVREGKKITLVACGSLVYQAWEAAEELGAEVINMVTVKPLDQETLLQSVKKTNRVVTLEEHSVYGGLGSAVAECLSQNYPVPVKIMGIADRFGQSARTYAQLLEEYGLTKERIIQEAKKLT